MPFDELGGEGREGICGWCGWIDFGRSEGRAAAHVHVEPGVCTLKFVSHQHRWWLEQ